MPLCQRVGAYGQGVDWLVLELPGATVGGAQVPQGMQRWRSREDYQSRRDDDAKLFQDIGCTGEESRRSLSTPKSCYFAAGNSSWQRSSNFSRWKQCTRREVL